jgi:hypothetical protein
MKKSSVSEWHNGSKKVTRMWKIMKEVVVQDLTEPMNVEKVRICCIQIDV